jgi:hypothetical protein
MATFCPSRRTDGPNAVKMRSSQTADEQRAGAAQCRNVREECCGETTFGYKLERDSIRISWVKADQYADRQRCQRDADCAMAFIIWESSSFSRA